MPKRAKVSKDPADKRQKEFLLNSLAEAAKKLNVLGESLTDLKREGFCPTCKRSFGSLILGFTKEGAAITYRAEGPKGMGYG